MQRGAAGTERARNAACGQNREDLADGWSEAVDECGAPVVVVGLSGAENGPLRSEDGRLHLMASHPRGYVRIKFRAPTLPFENFPLAEALGLSKPAPAFGFSPSSR